MQPAGPIDGNIALAGVGNNGQQVALYSATIMSCWPLLSVP